MPDHALERKILAVARPYLGPLDNVVAVEPERDPDHPGHTFDFAATRPDGTRVAIEITEADFPSAREDAAVLRGFTDEMVKRLRLDQVADGTYVLQTSADSPRMRDLVQHIVDVALTLEEEDEWVEVARHSNAFLRRFPRPESGISFGWWAWSGGGEFVAAHRGLLRRVLNDNRGKLERAGAAGYETILIVMMAWFGQPLDRASGHYATAMPDSWTPAFAGADEDVQLGEHPEHVVLVGQDSHTVMAVR